MTTLTVREVKEVEWDRWDQWLALQPWDSPFSSAWWLEANCRAFGGHPLLLGVLDGEKLVGGVALRITDVGPMHVVRPSYIYNPIVIAAASAQSRQQVLAALLEDMARRRLVVRPLKSTTDMVDLRQAVWHHWDLTASWTVVIALKEWTPQKDMSRRELGQLRKSQRAEVTARIEPPDADILHDLLRATVLRHGREPSLSREQLRVLVDGAGSHGMQVVARDVDGSPLSACFVMAHGPRIAYGIWAGTSPMGLTKGAAVAISVGLLGELQTRGYEYFDWCDASYPGYSDFKLKFGGTLKTCLAIAREPRWLKMAMPVYIRASQLKHALRGH
jgi:hypothetical protein